MRRRQIVGISFDRMESLVPLYLPERARAELGYAEVERLLVKACQSPLGREALACDPFPDTLDGVLGRIDDVLEAAHLVSQRSLPDFASIADIRPHLDHVEKDAVLTPPELREVARTLDAIARARALIESRSGEVPRLFALIEPISDERAFYRRVFRSIDEQGRITDEASSELAELRRRVRTLRQKAQERLEDLIRSLAQAEVLRERNFTIRNDRYVLPVKAEHQARVEGIVHDASQTGQTVFIEPKAILEIGNRIKIARAAVLEEEARILLAFTEQLREAAPRIRQDLERIGLLEACFARGTFAARIEAKKPRIVIDGGKAAALELFGARHPLLAWMRATQRLEGKPADEVVPNDIGFADKRALIITGPNAGGKTVALKTLGLSALLVRAGMPIPADERSRVPLCAAVLSTVGDPQSLGEALSSFSGHLVALRRVLDTAREQAKRGFVLCLLDEIASGTDPVQGAALAQAVLEELVELGARVVATTHYERLKVLAIEDEGKTPFRNASFALDPKTGRPTFELRLDQVGTSNALDAARRYGLPDRIIARAEALLDEKERDLGALLAQLAEKQAALERRIKSVEAERARLENDRERLRRRLDEVEREAERLRREGAKAFRDELAEARKTVAHAIERAKQGASPRELNALSHALKEEAERLEEKLGDRSEATTAPLVEVRPGDQVELFSLPGTALEVLEVNGDEVVLARGAMKLRAERASLRPLLGGGRKEREPRARPVVLEKAPRPAEPRSSDNTLDVRGERVAEAKELLEAFLDRLLKDGQTRGFILHGHGTGALKKAVREALAESRYVERFGPADPHDGGDACTVVELSDARP